MFNLEYRFFKENIVVERDKEFLLNLAKINIIHENSKNKDTYLERG